MNITYRSRVEKSVKKLQPIVEKIAETKLGDIEVMLMTDKRLDNYFSNPLPKEVRNKVYVNINGQKVILFAMAIPTDYDNKPLNAIAVPTNPLMTFVPTPIIEYFTAHELGHMAHLAIRGRNNFFSDTITLNRETEGIGHYIASLATHIDFSKRELSGLTFYLSGGNDLTAIVESQMEEDNIPSIKRYIKSLGKRQSWKQEPMHDAKELLDMAGVKKIGGVYVFGG